MTLPEHRLDPASLLWTKCQGKGSPRKPPADLLKCQVKG